MPEPRSAACWDCGHAISDHTAEYPGSDLRGIPRDEWPEKRPDQGCTVPGCDCRRWFEDEWGRRISR